MGKRQHREPLVRTANNQIILEALDKNHLHTISPSQARIVKENFDNGVEWWACCPTQTLTREQVARLATANWNELKD